uniref:Autophagy-related protein 3 n=1 Tax=Tetraselmis sp. GSL018 TaxID=582737 RepID=A0A061R5M9_9CHLO
MDAFKHTLHTYYKSTAERVLPVRTSSAFKEKGVLTPEEFVRAGDALVYSCPTWCWEAGDERHRKAYLPADKQYLVTRNVPCLARASAVKDSIAEEELVAGEGLGDEWVATVREGAGLQASAAEDIPTISGDTGEAAGTSATAAAAAAAAGAGGEPAMPDIDDIPDIGDLDIEDEEDDEAVLVGGALESDGGHEAIMRTRSYDLSITYDKYYQTPRFWLVGYNESKQPLPPLKVLEDVSEEHARKTITVDPHPSRPEIRAASIHPCKHAEVMKKLVDLLGEQGREIGVEQYLILFLKFIASIVPTIEYDYTLSIGGDR